MISTTGSGLTGEQLSDIRAALERVLTRLERNMAMNGNGDCRPREIDQSAVGRLSRIEAIQNQSLTQNLQQRERVQLTQILEALARLDDGSYGLCTECGSQIGFERLVVFPEAPHCSACSSGTKAPLEGDSGASAR